MCSFAHAQVVKGTVFDNRLSESTTLTHTKQSALGPSHILTPKSSLLGWCECDRLDADSDSDNFIYA